jgi:NAD(P)-dependent dehydrogenase (short-subunit alcohol dehydrogenase family)
MAGPEALRLAGKRVVVTGAASGIGRGISLQAKGEGARIGLIDRDEAMLKELQQSLGGPSPDVMIAVGDLSHGSEPARLINAAASHIGGIDGIVCAAGITRTSLAVDYTLADWNDVIAVNLTGAFLCAQAAARLMSQAGKGGSIVTISSSLAFTGQYSGVAYAASKAGIVAATKTLALELGAAKIRCNGIAPGVVDTPLVQRTLKPEYLAAWGARTPLGRVGQPEDLAPTACFLLSDESRWITGQTLHVNGGFIMH